MKLSRFILFGLAVVGFLLEADLVNVSAEEAPQSVDKGQEKSAAKESVKIEVEDKDKEKAPSKAKEADVATVDKSADNSEAKTEKTETKVEGAKAGDEKKGEGKKAESAQPNESHDYGYCLAHPAAIEDLKNVKQALDARQKELATRDLELKNRERAIEEQFKKLTELRDEVQKLDEARRKEREEKVAKLVETVEGMAPKASAGLLANVDENLAVDAMGKMSTAKLSKVLSAMEPARATRLTEVLTGVARAKPSALAREIASNGATAATPNNSGLNLKGGDKNGGISEQQRSDSGQTGLVGGKTSGDEKR
ncbi:hypothetical protein WDW86_17040 [Bdellovibrionota bacterium FG-2]